MKAPADILIIGAGITGLASALALHRAGARVQVFEQATALTEVGAGLTVGPNASRVLSALELGDQLAAIGHVPRHSGVLAHDSGERRQFAERGAEAYQAEFGAPFWHVHRADLVGMLQRALSQQVPIHCGHRLSGMDSNEEAVRAYFDNGARFEGRALLACDGLKSTIRQQMVGDGAPRFTGLVAWRGLVPSARLGSPDDAPDFSVSLGEGKMFTRYPVRARQWQNFVGIARQDDWREESWMSPAGREEVLAQFDGWHRGVRSLLHALPQRGCFKWGLHVRDPLEQWVEGRVALVGDAAHPMTPFLGLGAGMGIEDAWALGQAFAGSRSTPEALQRFQSARLERGNHIQKLSDQQGLALMGETGAGAPLVGPDPLGVYGYDVTAMGI